MVLEGNGEGGCGEGKGGGWEGRVMGRRMNYSVALYMYDIPV